MATVRPYPCRWPTVARSFSDCRSRNRMVPASPEPVSGLLEVLAPEILALEILAGRHTLDRPSTGRLLALGNQRPHVDDPLALLSGDLGPVVGVGGVGQILVFLVLLRDRRKHVVGADAPALTRDRSLDRQLLRPANDVFDYGAGREILE